ncbi:TerC family protein [Paenibacillus beijingensis]|uniref:Membrane protein n=1 Tax=Paenibacillus beijingensis TaxID=1126833 RepID=A0A0D5NM62_9BACL|nr:TerC family protein [Paenibacillus beijingensis]AJY76346.1 membrane protein [Paenibacillus beijingensis]
MDNLLTFLEIVLINVLLSGDNAVVIAMASQHLPERQRKRAVWWGAAAAVGLRCVLTLAAISMLSVPFLQAAGSLLLLYIAVKLLADAEHGSEGDGIKLQKTHTLAGAVRTIVAADFIMSLDNVLAIAAVADGDEILILLGIGISIPMIIWGSHLIGRMLGKFPSLVYIGAGLLGYAAGEMMIKDPGMNRLIFQHHATLHEAVPLLCIPLVIIVALLKRTR